MLSSVQKSLINEVALKEGFKNHEFSVEEITKIGGNYLGTIHRVTVKEKDVHNHKKFILKVALKNAEVRAQLPFQDIYQRELFMYQTVLPLFETFQEKIGLGMPFKAHPKCFQGSVEEGQECLLMEDLAETGYKTLDDRTKPLDQNHLNLVLHEVVKLHSVSLAMQLLEPQVFRSLQENLQNYWEKNEHFRSSLEANLEKRVDITLRLLKTDAKAVEALERCKKEIKTIVQEAAVQEQPLVVIHGDIWCNNLMFKYEDSALPTKTCLLDWQISQVQSPVVDLFYLLYLSASKDVLNNPQQFLDTYYLMLKDNLQSVNCDIRSILPRDLFQKHCKKFAKLSFLILLGNLLKLLKDENKSTNFDNDVEGGKGIWKHFFLDEDVSDAYLHRVKDIVYMMLDNKYI
ncbi:uncharacterized protein [Euwallacea fornicatus]|uniref:uncharacterized protein n=1 Tax=Euwallacea fornicatus TaxID=995702 RepID=UPI00338FBFEB